VFVRLFRQVRVLWLGLAVLPWALGLSVSGFSVKKRDENVGEEKDHDKSESTPLN